MPIRSSLRRIRTHVAACCTIAVTLAAGPLLAGCGHIQVTTVSGSPEGPTIAIGVSSDEPGIGLWHDGAYEGFDIEIAKYVATKLGYANKQIVFKQVRPGSRQSMLDNGQVDAVVASWAITDNAVKAVNFAGPYLQTGVGVLVRADDLGEFEESSDASADRNASNGQGASSGRVGAIGAIGAVDGRTVCTVQGDEAAAMFKANHPRADIQERASYPQCVTALQAGSADAIASDMAILSGLKESNGPQYMAVLADAGQVGYGIAVSKDTPQLASKIADALASMVQDGSWAKARNELKRQTHLKVTLTGTPTAIVSDTE